MVDIAYQKLLANFEHVPNDIITAIVDANDTRKNHITSMITERKPETVGIYRLTMKTGSDNFRQSAIQGIIERLKIEAIDIIVANTFRCRLRDSKRRFV